jgi:hypothetical protein
MARIMNATLACYMGRSINLLLKKGWYGVKLAKGNKGAEAIFGDRQRREKAQPTPQEYEP